MTYLIIITVMAFLTLCYFTPSSNWFHNAITTHASSFFSFFTIIIIIVPIVFITVGTLIAGTLTSIQYFCPNPITSAIVPTNTITVHHDHVRYISTGIEYIVRSPAEQAIYDKCTKDGVYGVEIHECLYLNQVHYIDSVYHPKPL